MPCSRALAGLMLAAATAAWAEPRRLGSTPSVTSTDPNIRRPSDFKMASRVYVPYGLGTGYAFGMGAAEQIAYDYQQRYAYAVSEQGYVNVVDLDNASAPQVLPALAVDLSGSKLTDIEVCSQLNIMFVAMGAADTVSNGEVRIYSTVQRSAPATPQLRHTEAVGPLPDMVKPNSDCTKVAVANEGEGKMVNGALVDPEGSVDILTVTPSGSSFSVSRERVALGSHSSDDPLIAMGVHLPLPLKAMEYWDDHSSESGSLDFSSARSSYTPRMNLEPECLTWSPDDSKVYVNLQENNAIATVNVPASGAPTFGGLHALGLKDHSTVGIDVVKDGACTMATYAGFKALRMPDAIQAVRVDGTDYVLTANEGDDKEYGNFEEKQKLNDVFGSDGSAQMTGMTAAAAASTTAQAVRAVSSKMRITVGSSAVDYSNSNAPNIQHVVAMGGRGISIFRDTSSGLQLAWDSGSSFETKLCEHYAWSHNGIQDEEFAPVNGVLYNSSSSSLQGTISEMNDPGVDGCSDGGDGRPGACPLGQTVDERSAKDGAGTEAIVAGVACGSLIAVTATEKSGVAFVYDITSIASPALLFVRHLSPASRTKNPGVAYASRELGEVDPEAMEFVEAARSPTGRPGVLFAGAWSGTLSFWEFECPPEASTTPQSGDGSGSSTSQQNGGSGSGASTTVVVSRAARAGGLLPPLLALPLLSLLSPALPGPGCA
uniref:Choice-of-anchor I domain-containing protein n=1 Tax=Alexandrium monilatum TaxID=311494 RepID=A0A7S4VTP5_9DINO